MTTTDIARRTQAARLFVAQVDYGTPDPAVLFDLRTRDAAIVTLLQRPPRADWPSIARLGRADDPASGTIAALLLLRQGEMDDALALLIGACEEGYRLAQLVLMATTQGAVPELLAMLSGMKLSEVVDPAFV